MSERFFDNFTNSNGCVPREQTQLCKNTRAKPTIKFGGIILKPLPPIKMPVEVNRAGAYFSFRVKFGVGPDLVHTTIYYYFSENDCAIPSLIAGCFYHSSNSNSKECCAVFYCYGTRIDITNK